jgi:hypothetical protein
MASAFLKNSRLWCFIGLLLALGGAHAENSNNFSAGSGVIAFKDTAAHQEKSIPVWYFYQNKPQPKTPIWILLPGVKRNAESLRDDWQNAARRAGAVLLVPEFTESAYPGVSYAQGNMLDRQNRPLDASRWAFSTLERLFDFTKHQLKISSTRYSLFGHSAGAQLIQRMVMFVPDARIQRAVAANAGCYVMPDWSIEFPYGFKQSGVDPLALQQALSVSLTLLVGEDDTDPFHPTLSRHPLCLQQGENRVARAQRLLTAGRSAADAGNQPFHWQLQMVSDVGHSEVGMNKAAQDFFLRDAAK